MKLNEEMQQSSMTAKSNAGGQCASFFVMVLSFFGVCLPAIAQTHVSKSTVSAHELYLGGFARTNRNCEGTSLPEIHLDQPPEHGFVCLRRGEVQLKMMFGPDQQKCKNRKTSGVRIIYQAHAGYTGADKVRYTVRFPKNQHSVEIDLTVVPDGSSPDKARGNADTREGKDNQMGLIPECSPLVS